MDGYEDWQENQVYKPVRHWLLYTANRVHDLRAQIWYRDWQNLDDNSRYFWSVNVGMINATDANDDGYSGTAATLEEAKAKVEVALKRYHEYLAERDARQAAREAAWRKAEELKREEQREKAKRDANAAEAQRLQIGLF